MCAQNASRLQIGRGFKFEVLEFVKVAFAVMVLMTSLCILTSANPRVANADELRASRLEAQSASNLAPGDLVYFGRYFQESIKDKQLFNELEDAEPQTISGKTCWEVSGVRYSDAVHPADDGNSYRYYFSEEPLRWYVLDNSGSTYTLISEKVIDTYEFYSIYDGVDLFWGDSAVRRWLNSDFLDLAFTASEQRDIVTSSIKHDISGGGYPFDRGVNPEFVSTKDKVYLIDGFEIDEGIFSNSDVPIVAKGTPYVDKKEQYHGYWLRGGCVWSYGNLYAAGVSSSGEIQTFIPSEGRGIRPVVRVKKSAAGLSAQKPVSNITVRFNKNASGAKLSKTSKQVKPGSAYGTLPTPKKTGKYFRGWYTSKSGGKKVTSKTTVTKKKNHTLYAHWLKAEIGNATVTVKNATWTGKALKPAVTVKLKGITLKRGTHYKLTYANNKEPGKGKVTVKGIGVFAKSKKKVTKTFNIAKAKQEITGVGDKTYAASKKGKSITLKPKVKGSAKLTFASSKPSVIEVANKSKGKLKLVAPGTATITIKAAATKHYKAASKKIKLVLKGSKQDISVNSSLLQYQPETGVYLLKQDVFSRSIGARALGGAKVTCYVEESGAKNQPWFESGDKLTAKGTGDFKVLICAAKTPAYPAASKTITVRMTGTSPISNNFTYQQTPKSTVNLIRYVGASSNVTVPNKFEFKTTIDPKPIIELAEGVFAGTKVKKVIFGDGSITSIGDNAFKGCASLQKVRLPVDLSKLGAGAFSGCTALSDIVLPDKIKSIGASAFEGCAALKGTFYLPNSLSKVAERAFYGCKQIKKLMVYSTLSSVGKNAFNGCSKLTDVYYSAPRSRWETLLTKVSSGNTPLTSAKMHYNAAGPTSAYEVSDITTAQLYREYPEYLGNASYETVTTTLENDLMGIIYGMSSLDVGLAALKEQMATGGIVYTMKALIDDGVHTDETGEVSSTWEEQKVAQALALELIKETSDSSEAQGVRDKLATELANIKKVADQFESAGDLVLKKEANKKSFASELSKVLPYSYDEVYAMLTQLQSHWEQDEGNTKKWTIKGIYGNLGKTIDAVEFACDVIILNEYYRENINAIMPYLPTDSGLYLGFSKLDKMMNYGLETYVTTLLRKEVVNELAKSMSDTALKDMPGASKGVLSAASAFYKVMSLSIDQPSIGDLNKAWLSATNTQLLHQIMREKNEAIIDAPANKRESHMSDHKLICTLYFASLKALGKYVIAIQDKIGTYDSPVAKDVAYLQQKLDRYSSGFTYSAYIRSCKELVAESGRS